MKLQLVDTHAHLDMPEFSSDREAVVERARQIGVNKIVTIGIDLDSSRKAIELANHFQDVYATVGIHPNDSADVSMENMAELEILAGRPKVVGLGEMGLDFYHRSSPKDIQIKVFSWQLDLAGKIKLPVVVDSRQAVKETLEILETWATRSPRGSPKGIIHCFSGDLPTANKYIEMGFYLALGGYVTYPSSLLFRKVIQAIPLDNIVLETDCPFLPPQQYRGKRNEPGYIISALQLLAEIKQIGLEEAAAITTSNALTVFN